MTAAKAAIDAAAPRSTVSRAGALSRGSILLALVIFSAGALVSLGFYALTRERAYKLERAQAERRALELASALQAGFSIPLEVLQSIPALFNASDDVTRVEFRAFVKQALARWPEIYALEWFPLVPASERARFEAEARAQGAPHFQFSEVGADGALLRAAERREYLPLYFMEPPNPVALGFDLSSEPARVAPAFAARDSGAPVVSPRIRLVEDAPSVFSIAGFSPIYAGGVTPDDVAGRRRAFRGAAAIVFRVRPVVERVLRGLDSEPRDFVLLDRSTVREGELLYESRAGLAQAFASSRNAGSVSERGIHLADREWRLVLDTPQRDHGAIAVLGGGLVLSLLLALSSAGAAALREFRRRMRQAQRLGQYTLVEQIGEGGMGVVYRAQHALLSRPTAIKLLPPEVGEDRLLRFEREAQRTSELTHPNTIVVYDYGRSADGTLYYVMEYLDGITLEELVRKDSAQPPARVVHLLTQVCGALAEAHAVDLIHRDVKPANLMLTRRGGVPDFVKVLDFGLVKQLAASGAAALSGSQTMLGTPGYVAPEAIMTPERVDARSDIYSLGAVAYYLLTGELVFKGETVIEISAQHLHGEPVRPSLRAGYPIAASLEAVVLKCLEKLPEDRFQSAAELEQALATCVSDVGAWTRADAEAWWQKQRTRRATVPTKSAEPRTLAVDLARRRAKDAS